MSIRVGRIRLSHEDDDLAPRVGRVRGVPLPTADHVVVAVARDRALDVRCVARRDRRLGHRKGRADLTGEKWTEPLLLLLRGAVPCQDLHVAGIGCRAVEHLRGEVRSAHHLTQRRVLHIAQTRAQLTSGEEQIPETGLSSEWFQLLHHRPDRPRPELHRLAKEARFARIDVLIHE